MICSQGLRLADFFGLTMLTSMKMNGYRFDPTLASTGWVSGQRRCLFPTLCIFGFCVIILPLGHGLIVVLGYIF
jgi:hypothetical protein